MVKINTAGHWETDYDLGGALTDSSKLWMSDEIATLYKTSQDQGFLTLQNDENQFKKLARKLQNR